MRRDEKRGEGRREEERKGKERGRKGEERGIKEKRAEDRKGGGIQRSICIFIAVSVGKRSKLSNIYTYICTYMVGCMGL